MDNKIINSRKSSRIQLDNSSVIEFVLHDHVSGEKTCYCVCADLSAVGGLFVTDREFTLGQQLVLTVRRQGQSVETVDVTVIRGEFAQYDEERYCAAVRFDQPMRSISDLKELKASSSQSIAA